jgi:hypothetical protein
LAIIVVLLVMAGRSRRTRQQEQVQVLQRLHGQRVSALVGSRFYIAKSRQMFDVTFTVGEVRLGDGEPRVAAADIEVTNPRGTVYDDEVERYGRLGLPLDDLWVLTAPDGQRHVWQRVVQKQERA